jgi:hypothetical protein
MRVSVVVVVVVVVVPPPSPLAVVIVVACPPVKWLGLEAEQPSTIAATQHTESRAVRAT